MLTKSIASTAEAVAALLDRMAAGNAAGIADLFTEGPEWLVPGNPELPWVGSRSHRDEIVDYFLSIWSHVDTSTVELEQIVVAGDDAVVFARFTHSAAETGRSWRTSTAFRVRVNAVGRIARFQVYEDTLAVSEAFFPSRPAEDY